MFICRDDPIEAHHSKDGVSVSSHGHPFLIQSDQIELVDVTGQNVRKSSLVFPGSGQQSIKCHPGDERNVSIYEKAVTEFSRRSLSVIGC
jgi:hypothetical protein